MAPLPWVMARAGQNCTIIQFDRIKAKLSAGKLQVMWSKPCIDSVLANPCYGPAWPCPSSSVHAAQKGTLGGQAGRGLGRSSDTRTVKNSVRNAGQFTQGLMGGMEGGVRATHMAHGAGSRALTARQASAGAGLQVHPLFAAAKGWGIGLRVRVKGKG